MSKNEANQELTESLTQFNQVADDKEIKIEIKTESMEVDHSIVGDMNNAKEEIGESSRQVNQASDVKEIKPEIKIEFMQVEHPSNGEETSGGVKEESRESLSQLNQTSDNVEIKPVIKTELMQVDSSNGGVMNEGIKEELTDDQEIKPFSIKTESTQPQTSNGGVANVGIKQELIRESLDQTNQAVKVQEIMPFTIKTEPTQPSNGEEAANAGGAVQAENNMVGLLTDMLVASFNGYTVPDRFGENGSDENKLTDLQRPIINSARGPGGVSVDSDGSCNGVVTAGENERRLSKGKRKCEGDDGVKVRAKFVCKLFGFDVYSYEEEVGDNSDTSVFGRGANGSGSGGASGGGGSSYGGGSSSQGGASGRGGGSGFGGVDEVEDGSSSN